MFLIGNNVAMDSLDVVYMQRRHNSAALRALLAHLEEFAQAFRQAEDAKPARHADCR